MRQMTGARFIAETFHGYGITHVFFMPYILPRALFEMETLGIRRIMAHGEKAAAYMADGYARASQRVGVCMAQSVGAANLAAGLQDAYLACSPVLALTGRRTQDKQHRHAYQEIDHAGLVCARHQIRRARGQRGAAPQPPAPGLSRGHHGNAGAGPPRSGRHQRIRDRRGRGRSGGDRRTGLWPGAPFPSRAGAGPGSRKRFELLAQAKRPVIVAGGGVTASQAGPELVELAEKLSIPVATSLNAKAMFPC